MKILFLTDNFPPESNAPATRTSEHVLRWQEHGHQVTVITCAPNFPGGKVYTGYRNRLYSIDRVNGVKVIRVWSYVARNAGFLKRALDYASYAVSASIAALFQDFDICVATSPQFFTAVAGCVVGTVRRKPWVFELRDIWPVSITAVCAMRPGPAVRFLEAVELFLYRRATVVVPVTESFKKNLVSRGIRPEKIHVVFNGLNPSLFACQDRRQELAAAIGLNGCAAIGYLGTMGMAHALRFVILAACKRPNIDFVLIGDGAERPHLESLLRRCGSRNVMLLPPVSKQEVPRYLSLFDYSLVNLRRSPVFKEVVPSKIFEYAAMRRPILLGVDGEARQIIEKYGAGIAYAPENEASFLSAVDRAVAALDDSTYSRYQDGCERLAVAYDRSKLADQMLALLKRITDR